MPLTGMSVDTLVLGDSSSVISTEAGLSTGLTAGVEEEGAKEWQVECGCPVTVVDTRVHKKHKGMKKEGCYQCISKLIDLGSNWQTFYAKYAATRVMVGLRDAFKKGTGSEPADKTVMTLYKCAMTYPNVQVRAFVHCKYGGVVLAEVERAHNELRHKDRIARE